MSVDFDVLTSHVYDKFNTLLIFNLQVLQNFMFGMLKDANAIAAKMSLV